MAENGTVFLISGRVGGYFSQVVAEAFEGHEAYTEDPYINPVMFGPRSQDLDRTTSASSYSMHPNEKGIEAYRKCVQEAIDELEKER